MSRTFKPTNCIICNKTFTPINAKAAKFCSWECKLETKFDKSGGPDACWPFIGKKVWTGYGQVAIGNGKQFEYAHRAVWMKKNGPIPPRIEICHTCDNPPCGNDKHLFAGTKGDNMRDCIAKGRGRWRNWVLDEEGRKRKARLEKRMQMQRRMG